MLRRPQRTEAAQRLEARTARTFAAPLRAGVSKIIAPRAAKRKPLRLKREDGAYRRLVQPQHGERVRCGTGRAAQQCTRRARVEAGFHRGGGLRALLRSKEAPKTGDHGGRVRQP